MYTCYFSIEFKLRNYVVMKLIMPFVLRGQLEVWLLSERKCTLYSILFYFNFQSHPIALRVHVWLCLGGHMQCQDSNQGCSHSWMLSTCHSIYTISVVSLLLYFYFQSTENSSLVTPRMVLGNYALCGKVEKFVLQYTITLWRIFHAPLLPLKRSSFDTHGICIERISSLLITYY